MSFSPCAPDELAASGISDLAPPGPDDLAFLDRDRGLGGVVKLDGFDSGVFGASMGILTGTFRDAEATEAVAAAALEYARPAFAHLRAQVDAADLAVSRGLTRAGFALVQVGVDFVMDVKTEGLDPKARPTAASGIAVALANEAQAEVVAERFATIFRGSRFYVDPFCDDAKADELHRRWIRNCAAGRADAFLVALDGDAVAGFVTCRLTGAYEGR
ncbi:MAG: hypothetical protein AAGF12_24805, partial [Myxococcota bacterium]